MDDQPDIGASVRIWKDIVSRARFDKVIPGTHPGRFIKASTVKAVAARLADYADPNGRRVFPGIARLAADCQISYDLAARCVKGLRDLGLIDRVRRAVRRNPRSTRERTDEYRLILAEDLLERLHVPTPSDYRSVVEVIAKPHRQPDLDAPMAGLEPADLDAPTAGLETPAPPESNPAADSPDDGSNPVSGTDLTLSESAATSPRTCTTSTTSHSGEDVSYDAAATRAPEADAEDPNFVVEEIARPSLRVVAGGGRRTPTQPALWPVSVPTPTPVADAPAVPVRPASARQTAIAAMRSNLAAVAAKPKPQRRKRHARPDRATAGKDGGSVALLRHERPGSVEDSRSA